MISSDLQHFHQVSWKSVSSIIEIGPMQYDLDIDRVI
jgi:hypothetical protein